jgi:hypothetical protein
MSCMPATHHQPRYAQETPLPESPTAPRSIPVIIECNTVMLQMRAITIHCRWPHRCRCSVASPFADHRGCCSSRDRAIPISDFDQGDMPVGEKLPRHSLRWYPGPRPPRSSRSCCGCQSHRLANQIPTSLVEQWPVPIQSPPGASTSVFGALYTCQYT